MPTRTDQRRALARRLAVNAATKPANVLGTALFAAVALLVWTPLVLAAPLLYALLVAITFLDADEAARLARPPARTGLGPSSGELRDLSDELRGAVTQAQREARALLDGLARTPAAPPGVGDQVRELLAELEAVVPRAAALERYLATVDEDEVRRTRDRYREGSTRSLRAAAAALDDQLEAIAGVRARRDELVGEVAHLGAGLAATRARLVQAEADAAPPSQLEAEVSDLREQARVLAEGVAEAYGAVEPGA